MISVIAMCTTNASKSRPLVLRKKIQAELVFAPLGNREVLQRIETRMKTDATNKASS